MKKLTLQRITLSNFKGARSFTLEPKGGDIAVYGRNGKGKSTIADAWFWLLFDKDSGNRKDFAIKPLDVDGKAESGLEHMVEAELSTDRGMLRLKKIYKECWTKKRGSATEEFTGHTTDYFVNSVPVQMKEYEGRIAELCDEKTFRLLTDPTYFSLHLKWEDRRRMLIDLCGDVSDEDVIEANSKLSELPAILGQHRLEDYRKIIAARRKEINTELSKLPVRIDEVKRSIPASISTTIEEVEANLAAYRATLSQLQTRKAEAAAGGEIAEKTIKVKQIEAELQDIANRVRSACSEAHEQGLKLAREKDAEIAAMKSSITTAARDAETYSRERARIEPKLAALRQERDNEKAKGFAGDTSCPACGQALPAEQIERATQEFNQAKARRLEAILAEGKSLRAQFDALEESVRKANDAAAACQAALEVLEGERQTIFIPQSFTSADLGNDADYARKSAERADLLTEIESMRAGSTSEVPELQAEIDATTARIAECEAVIANQSRKAEAEQRMRDIKAQERTLAAEFEKLEKELFLTELFIRTKVSMLTDRINSRFTMAKFKLFEEQVNGAIAECCEATYDGVPYSRGLNHGACINAGLDIINVFAEHIGFAPPIFIDGAESVHDLLPTSGQKIRLEVSKADHTLRIETESAPKAQEELLVA